MSSVSRPVIARGVEDGAAARLGLACRRVAGWAARVIEPRAEDRRIRPRSHHLRPVGLKLPR
jgi:hypothetical protein